ncbi:precorrin-3B synthase [Agrobacterium larrymoorei]|uniref:Precorrin-3B synthase n=1 Tax=Agrobacterium larrymoorei TaxID=160699 RepID=A0A4D7DHJ8_9HYPH|nr:precorrin-3B synthase [Agrobacterium larrymoorei]QCI96683.1 precorrin-3B synthase [Agrobacterium larrymoorei]QYA07895.1 precorrin-3B synthase [Agrobacterium larrymoorei]
MTALPDIQPFSRRGVCPALSAPMQTGDGLLSRVAFTDDLSPNDLVRLCDLSRHHGNGLVDITARGSFQFRGLTAESAVALERDVLELGLPLRQGLAVETSPLAGVDGSEIADPRVIIRQISENTMALRLHERLAAKMSVIVDGGGLVLMGDLLADIRLKAVTLNSGIVWQLMLGGSEGKALLAGVLQTKNAADCVVELLSHLADLGPDARGRDLDIDTVRQVCGARLGVVGGFGLPPSVPLDISPSMGEIDSRQPLDPLKGFELDEKPTSFQSPPLRAGQRGVNHTHQRKLWPLKSNLSVAVIAPAFGQIPSGALSDLCKRASELNVKSVRPGPLHALYFLGTDEVCDSLLDYAENAGFIVSDNDPRTSIAVCSGSPACASAFAPVRELAEFAAKECVQVLDGSFTLHLSGCGKGCAHPSPALLAFSGTSDGLAFGYCAKVSAVPDGVLPFADQKAALSRLARLYEKEHKPGENARALLSRLGKARIVEALRQDER